MYLQITTKCNMKCGHCCMSCEPGKGEHMQMTTFRQALETASDCGNSIVLGGGEPTLNPYFEKMLLEALAAADDEVPPLVITNGTHKARSLMLARLAKNGVIGAELSYDSYHDLDMVDPKVFRAFNDIDKLRDVDGYEKMQGRYLEITSLSWDEIDHDDCACDDWIVQPDGMIKQCACQDAPIVGNVKGEGIFPKYVFCNGVCFHSDEFADAMEEYNDMIERAVAADTLQGNR